MLAAISSQALFGGREPSTYSDRIGSRNAKYDSLLGNTYSLRTNRASKETLERLGTEIAKSQEDKVKQRAEEQKRLYEKLGIKAPTGMRGAEGHRNEGQAVAALQKYKMGASQPPWATPGVGLSEMLQHILYPRPPVDETHGLPTFGSGPVLHPPIHGHDSQAYPFDNTPLQGLPAVPPGWFLSPYTGWYFVPPYQVLSTSSATDPVSPLCTRTYRQHHPSSNSAFLGPPDSISPSQARSDSQVPPLHRTGSISPEPVYLKSALRSTSSDPVTTPRQVRFRETPDIAFLSQTSSVSSLSNGHGVLQADQTPRWTLHKHSASRQKPSKDIDGNTEPLTKPLDSRPSVCDAVDEYPSLSLGDGTRGLDAYLSHDLHDARSGEVPDSLRAAHRRLLDFETEDTHASGKRSGKHLVRELERMAETATNGHFRGPYHWKTSQEIESRNGEDDYAHGSIKMSSSAGTGPGFQAARKDSQSLRSSQDHATNGDSQYLDLVPDRSHSPDSPDPDTYSKQSDSERESRVYDAYRGPQKEGFRTDYDHHAGSPSTSSPHSCHSSVKRRRDVNHDLDALKVPHPTSPTSMSSESHRVGQANRSPTPDGLMAEPEPETKRVRLTERAWQYAVPNDKLPPPPPPRAKPRHRSPRSQARTTIKPERSSQLSQIEVSDNGQEQTLTRSSQHETIDGSWPHSQNERLSQARLDTIHETDDQHVESRVPIRDQWVEEGFFQGAGDVGFKVWRDGY